MNNPVIQVLLCCLFVMNANMVRGDTIPAENLSKASKPAQATKITQPLIPALQQPSCVVRTHPTNSLRKKRPVKTQVPSHLDTNPLQSRSPSAANEKTFPIAKTSTGKSIVLANQQQQLVSWNTEAECPLYFEGHHQSNVIDIIVSPNDRYVLSSSQDRKVKVWDFETGKELTELVGNEHPIAAIALSESGVIAALGSMDSRISIWDMEHNKKMNVYKNKHAPSQQELNGGVSSLALTVGLKGQWLAVADNAGWVTLWDIRDGTIYEDYKAFNQKVRTIKLTAGGEYIVAGSAEGKLLIWNKLTKEKKIINLNQGSAAIEKVDISPDGQYVLAGDQAGKVYLIEMDAGIINYGIKVSGASIILASFNNNEEATIVDSEYQIWRFRLDNKQLAPISDISWSAITPKSLAGLAGQNWREPKTETEFIWVPGSCFDMGCKYPEDEGCATDNTPSSPVCLDGYWMAKQMVSRDQWLKVMGYALPLPEIKMNMLPEDLTPLATGVSWFGSQGFVCKMNRLTGYNLAIPSEAEWEKACRSGDEQQIKNQDVNTIGIMDSREMSAAPLAMMHINEGVNEWMLDYYDVHSYHFKSKANPVYLSDDFYYYYNQDVHRVKRGGGWDTGRTVPGCITRQFGGPDDHSLLTGFRITAH